MVTPNGPRSVLERAPQCLPGRRNQGASWVPPEAAFAGQTPGLPVSLQSPEAQMAVTDVAHPGGQQDQAHLRRGLDGQRDGACREMSVGPEGKVASLLKDGPRRLARGPAALGS